MLGSMPSFKRKSSPNVNVADQTVQSLLVAPAHKSTVIREAADIVLNEILNQYNNFPSRGGYEVSASPAVEYDGSKIFSFLVFFLIFFFFFWLFADPNNRVLYFIYNDKLILSLHDLSGYVRVIIRTSTGKYVWDYVFVPDTAERYGHKY